MKRLAFLVFLAVSPTVWAAEPDTAIARWVRPKSPALNEIAALWSGPVAGLGEEIEGQALSYTPSKDEIVGTYLLSGSSWTPATTSSTSGALSYVPRAGALYCLNTGTGQWVPATTAGNCFGGNVGSVSNSDGTLTITPTTGAVVAGINLANANVWTAPQTAPQFNVRSLAASPQVAYFNDFFSASEAVSANIGSPSGQSLTQDDALLDVNHAGDIVLASGTVTSTGINAIIGSANGIPLVALNSATLGWTWEAMVNVPVLPGTTAAAYQAGVSNTINVNPYTTGIEFYLSSANAVPNDWYCRFSTTQTDSGIAAVGAAWTRLTMISDAAFVHWYINGVEATGCKTAVASMPSSQQTLMAVSAVNLTGTTSVKFDIDYLLFQRAVTR